MRAPPGVLGEIVDRTRNDLAVREGRVPAAQPCSLARLVQLLLGAVA